MPVLTKINTNSIAEDAITGDKFAGDAYLANTTTQNISGTYSENRLYTSDAYTLSGNATVNSNLSLSSVKPNDDVVLTAGGAYTITGTGVLSGGSLLTKTNTDASNLSGTLGNGVTIGSGITFPSNHCVFVKQHTFTSVDASTNPPNSNFESWANKNFNGRWVNTSLEVIVPSAEVAKCSKIYVHVQTLFEIDPESSSRINIRLIRVGHVTNQSDCLAYTAYFGENYNTGNLRSWLSVGGWDDPLGTGDHIYHLEFTKDHASYADLVKYHGTTGDIATMTAWGYV